jgi:hypothetical protein
MVSDLDDRRHDIHEKALAFSRQSAPVPDGDCDAEAEEWKANPRGSGTMPQSLHPGLILH